MIVWHLQILVEQRGQTGSKQLTIFVRFINSWIAGLAWLKNVKHETWFYFQRWYYYDFLQWLGWFHSKLKSWYVVNQNDEIITILVLAPTPPEGIIRVIKWAELTWLRNMFTLPIILLPDNDSFKRYSNLEFYWIRLNICPCDQASNCLIHFCISVVMDGPIWPYQHGMK